MSDIQFCPYCGCYDQLTYNESIDAYMCNGCGAFFEVRSYYD